MRSITAAALALALAMAALPAAAQQKAMDHSGHAGGMTGQMSGQMSGHTPRDTAGGMAGHTAAGMAGMATDGVPTEPGQGAFAAIAEIVAMLQADPATDWSRVNIEALRQHLIDMSNVTLKARVTAEDIPGGARFSATGTPEVLASLKRMVPAHARVMEGVRGWHLVADPSGEPVTLEVTGPEAEVAMIRGLGFIGVMATGAHHQPHHLAIARGMPPH